MNFSFLLFVVVVVVCALIVLKKALVRKVDLDHIPGIKEDFLTFLQEQNSEKYFQRHEKFYKLALKYGSVAKYENALYNFVLVSDPEDVQWVLEKNQDNYPKTNKLFKGLTAMLFPFGLAFLPTGPEWRHRRDMVGPLFTWAQLKSFLPLFEDSTKQLMKFKWNDETLKKDTPIDVVPDIMKLTLLVVGSTMMGEDFHTFEGNSAVAESFGELPNLFQFKYSFWLIRNSPLPDVVKWKRAKKIVDDFFKTQLEHFQGEGKAGNNLLSRLLYASHPETGESLSLQDVKDQVLTFFIAGHETTGLLLSWVLYHLAIQPDIQQRLFEEVSAVCKKGESVTLEHIKAFDYLECVIKEAVRCYPTAANLVSREAQNDDTIKGLKIPKGTIVIVSPYVTHHLPSYWPNPYEFNPARFFKDAPETLVAKHHRLAHIGFGAGYRSCIGQAYAMLEAKLIIAMLVLNYTFHAPPNLHVRSILTATLHPEGLKLIIKKRV